MNQTLTKNMQFAADVVRHAAIAKLMSTGLILCLMSGFAAAQPPSGAKGKGDRSRGAAGGARPARGGDPAEVAAKMIGDFDKNKDSKLQELELAAALTAQRQQRGNQGPGGTGAGQGGPRQRGGAQGGPKQRGQGQRAQGQRGQGKGTQQGRPGGQPGAGPGGENRRGAGRRGAGQMGQRGQGQPGQRGAAGNPNQLVAQMIQEFDKSGDKALNVDELTAALAAQRERRGAAGRAGEGGGTGRVGGPAGRRGPAAAGKAGAARGDAGAKGGRRGNREEAEVGGGVAPKRPSE